MTERPKSCVKGLTYLTLDLNNNNNNSFETSRQNEELNNYT